MKCEHILCATLPQKVSQRKPITIKSTFTTRMKKLVIFLQRGLCWDDFLRQGRAHDVFAFHGFSIFFRFFYKMLVVVSGIQESRSRITILADPENAEGNDKNL